MSIPLQFFKLTTLPEIRLGDNLENLIEKSLLEENISLGQGDIIVITHKIVSKALGLVKKIDSVEKVSEKAKQIAVKTHKDPRFVELILNESQKLFVYDNDIILGLRKDGFLCCNSGIDHSNSGDKRRVVILPKDCNEIAKKISNNLSYCFGFPIPVIICDTHGRVIREGTTGIVVGSFGISPTRTYKGKTDRQGMELLHTNEAIADELAGAATFLMGQGNEGVPLVIIRGSGLKFSEENCDKLKRPIKNMLLQPMGKLYDTK